MKTIMLILSLFLVSQVHAVTIEFPEDELAQESVLPVFDNAVAVKSRTVPTAGKVELGLGLGTIMNEPFFNSSRFGGHLAYHFTETHGVFLQGQMYADGLGSNGKTLAQKDLVDNPNRELFIRMEHAPQPKYHLLANYQITPYYGKISVFKDFVMNLSLYGLVGVGTIAIGDTMAPALNLGIGQKFYFGKRWGFRVDLGLLAYEGVNYFRASDGGASPLADTIEPGNGVDVTEEVSVSEFERQMNYDMHFTAALIILL